jgi:hypothetical protein
MKAFSETTVPHSLPGDAQLREHDAGAGAGAVRAARVTSGLTPVIARSKRGAVR